MSLPRTGVAQNADLAKVQAAAELARFRPSFGQIAQQTPSGVTARPVSGFRGQPFRRGRVSPLANLILTKTKPSGYATPPEGVLHPIYVTWGKVNNRPPSNVGAYTSAENGKKVAIKANTNGLASPTLFKVTAVEIVAAVGDVPEDSGGTDTTPPTTCYFLIGEITVTGEGEAAVVTVNTRPGGNLRLQLREVGSACFGPTDDYPTGGSRTTYDIEWVDQP